MKRTISLLLVLSGMIVPCRAVKRVTAAQLEQIVAGLHGKPDADLAYQIGDLELTERLSAEQAARLGVALPGEKSRQALTAIADASSFQPPPAEEIPSTAAPDITGQRKIMGLVANYVTKTIPQLPNFFANRATTRFEDTPLLQKPDGFIPYEPLHQVGTSSATALYRDGREFEDAAGTKIKTTAAQGLTTWGEFGPILGTVLLDAAQSKLAWSRWEQGSAGLQAVFAYEVPREKSHYEVNYCCIVNPGVPVGANVAPFRQIVGYRGEMAVDPSTGTVLRLSAVATLKPDSPVSRADILVSYGPVEIGGKTYICPLKSVSVTTAQMVQQTERYAQPLANQMQPLKTMLNDVRFDQYHMFRADARVLAAETVPGLGHPPLTTNPIDNPVSSNQAGAAVSSTPSAPVSSAPSATPAALVAAEPAPPPPPTLEISVTDSADVPNAPAHLQAVAPGSEFTLRTTTRLVDVGLVAYDKKGHPVTDLKESDFEIYDNGRKLGIRYFAQASQIAAPGPTTPSGPGDPGNASGDEVITNRPAPRAATSQTSPESHSLVLLIDAANLAWGDLSYAREEMLRFLKSLPVGEQVGLYILRSYGSQVLVEPTGDHAQVADRLSKWMPTAQEVSRAQEEEQRNRQHIDWVARMSDLNYVNGNEQTAVETQTSNNGQPGEALKYPVDARLRDLGSNPEGDALLLLIGVARHLAALPGHKNLVWVASDNVLADWNNNVSRSENTTKFLDPLSIHARESMNEAHVSLYPLDASQLEPGGIGADLRNRNVEYIGGSGRDSLQQGLGDAATLMKPGRDTAKMHQDTHSIQGAFRDLAEATGGRALRRAGDIAAELNGIAADGRAAYLLSFTPDGSADDKYHLITIKLAAHHDLTLRYRTGYLYEKEPATLKQRFQRAVWQPRDMNDIALTAVASGSAAARVLKVGIAATDLDMAQAGNSQTGEFWTDKLGIFLIERDDDALKAKVTGRTLGLHLRPETYQKALREGIPFNQPLPAKPGSGSLRVIVVDENSGRMGSVTLPSNALTPH